MLKGKVLLTGGAGTLGRAIIRRAIKDKWDCEFTIYSRDPMKHHVVKALFPDAPIKFVLGDIMDGERVGLAIAGHDIVLHLAAMKHIPEGERDPIYMYEVNVGGTLNVAAACGYHLVEQAVFISTDKACYPVNAYGTTKKMGEYVFQQHAEFYIRTKFNTVRYGNVIGSTGSVVQVWREMLKEHGKIYATDPHMTRFWLTDDMAVDIILAAMGEPSGTILIPEMQALSMEMMAKYTLPKDTEIEYEGLRPGEKRHETLITPEETQFAANIIYGIHDKFPFPSSFQLWPSTSEPRSAKSVPLVSNKARQLTKKELLAMIGE